MTASAGTPSGGTGIRKPRLSNIELLRLLSMFMVLVLHADYAALGVPAAADLSSSPAETTARVLLEQLSLVAVNVFVLISGWFGVRLTVRSLGTLLFQVLFYAVLIAAVVAATLGIPAAQRPTAWLTLVPGYHHWFIRSYIGLMLLSPVLNAFTASCTVRRLAVVTGSFFAFQTLYGWICGADGFLNGYSLLSFIGLYLLGQLAHRLQWHTPSPCGGVDIPRLRGCQHCCHAADAGLSRQRACMGQLIRFAARDMRRVGACADVCGDETVDVAHGQRCSRLVAGCVSDTFQSVAVCALPCCVPQPVPSSAVRCGLGGDIAVRRRSVLCVPCC